MRELMSEYGIAILAAICASVVLLIFVTAFMSVQSPIKVILEKYIEGFIK